VLDKITLFQNARVWAQIRDQVLDLVDQEHSKGLAQNGPLVAQLETTLAKRFDRKHCVTTANCTDALTIAVQLLCLPPNSRIAVPNYTFTATAHAVARAGHSVVPVDVLADNYTIDVSAIPQGVRAVIAVDLFGNMSNWAQLNQLGIPIINDAAQSLESHDGSMWSASHGVISCVSFSPSKTISSWGSGGALLTDNAEIAQQARRLRLHGKTNNSQQALAPGLNSMLSSFEAAAVLVGLEYSPIWCLARRGIAQWLISESACRSAIDHNSLVQHTHSKLVFAHEDRDRWLTQLAKNGVDHAIHYNQLISDELLYPSDRVLNISHQLKAQSFTVPNQHTLTDLEVERIAKALK
jgi:UDP-2-acetamido-2-deoxy-ribo-hexuluronate aminotransferase